MDLDCSTIMMQLQSVYGRVQGFGTVMHPVVLCPGPSLHTHG